MTATPTAPLTERYRPATWQEVIGQPKAVAQLQRLAQRGALTGRAYWLSGKSGTGKTTIARLLAADVASEWTTEERDAGALTCAELRKIADGWRLRVPWGKGGHALILNEAHGLRKDVIRALLVLLEQLPETVAVIFTTTADGQESLFEDSIDAGPLLSRCLFLSLSSQGIAKPMAERLREIAQREGMDGKPVSAYLRLVEDNKCNMRACLQSIEAGAMLDAKA